MLAVPDMKYRFPLTSIKISEGVLAVVPRERVDVFLFQHTWGVSDSDWIFHVKGYAQARERNLARGYGFYPTRFCIQKHSLYIMVSTKLVKTGAPGKNTNGFPFTTSETNVLLASEYLLLMKQGKVSPPQLEP